MKKTMRMLVLLLVLSMLIIPQTGCGKEEPAEETAYLLNTICTIKLYEPADHQLAKQALDLCRTYENLLSATIASSDIGRINSAKGAEVLVNPQSAYVIQRGVDYGSISHGLFDISVGELTNLWDFGGDDPHVPSAAAIQSCLPHIGYEKVKVGKVDPKQLKAVPSDDKTVPVQINDPVAQLDLGGIAKGYIADRLTEFLKEKGVKRGIVNLGGNIVVIGDKAENTPWKVGIEMPFSDHKEIIGNVSLSNASIVTSGIYERQFTENGVLYYHVLDPKTGYPRKTDLEAVSIIGTSSIDCDALSTTCLMLGVKKARELIDSLPDYGAVFIDKDGKISMTNNVKLEPVK